MSVDDRGVATVTLDRPGQANAYDYATLVAVAEAFARFGNDDRVRVVVLRGAGRHFCAGADRAGAEPDRPGAPGVYMLIASIEACPKPTVALVQGACIGGGVALAAACDIVVAAPDAFFSLPETRLGHTPGPLGLLFCSASGLRPFRRYGLTGQRFGAEEALRIGLVQRIGGLEDELEEILSAAPAAARNAKLIGRRLAGEPSRALVDELQAGFMALRHPPKESHA